MALKLRIQALRSYLKLTCENNLHILSSTKVCVAEDHGEKCRKIRPPSVRHLLCNRLFIYPFSSCRVLPDYSLQVILAGTLTEEQGDIRCKFFGGPPSSNMTWAGTGLIEGCNRRKCVLVVVYWNEVHTGEVSDVCKWIQFGRDTPFRK